MLKLLGYVEGGFNGGGKSGYYQAGSGGGASDIRIGSDSLYARVIVAGGGGGAANYNNYSGGNGGGDSGSAGVGYNTTYNSKGGTQTAGGAAGYYSSYKGSAGTFGNGGQTYQSTSNYNRSGGGGGGWYGGGGGGYRSNSSSYYYGVSGGGGGSGYAYTESTAANYPSGCILNSNYYLTDTDVISGKYAKHEGAGFCKITVLKQENEIDGEFNLGENSLNKMFIGNSQIKKAYFNSNLVFPAISFNYIDYIESTGTQYIDTGVPISPDLSFECEWMATENNDAGLNGSYYFLSGTTKAYCFGLYNGKIYSGIGSIGDTSTDGSIYTKYKTVGAPNQIATYEGETLKVSKTGTLVDNGLNFYLFCAHQHQDNIQPYYFSYERIYSCKIYKNGILIRDFKPIIDRNGQAGLYDEIEKKIYYSETNNFKVPEKIEDYDFLSYIQNNNSAYINTKVKINANTQIEIKGGTSSGEGYFVFAGFLGKYMSGIGANSTGKIYGRWRNGDSGNATKTTTIDMLDNKVFKISKDDFSIDGTSQGNFGTSYNFTEQNDLFLFYPYSSASSEIINGIQGKIYYCKVTKNNILIRDLVPAKNKKSNKIGLFDKITNTFFLSSNSNSSFVFEE